MKNKLSKRMQKVAALVDSTKAYSLVDALKKVKEYSSECAAKFDESVEMVMELGIDARQTDQAVRGSEVMPSGLGKAVKVAVFVSEDKIKAAKDAGADIAGADELVELVKAGKAGDFDVCIATPDMMGKVGLLGKVLGPKGLMPNAKLGTLTPDFAAAIKNVKAGQVSYKNEKGGIVHAGVGKMSFSEEALKANIVALYNAVLRSKPTTSKGVYMRNVYISTTMGPSIKLDLQSMVS